MRVARRAIVVLPAAVLIISLSCAGGPDHFVEGDLLLMVYSTDHEPVTNGTIRDGRRSLGGTDSFGRLVVPGLRAGEYELLASAPGFAPELVGFSFRNPTQILYVTLRPLGPVCAEAFLERDTAALAELLTLLEAAKASREERSLVHALLRAATAEEGWRDELASLSGKLGRRRSEDLLRAVEGTLR
ncbi:MAG: hypothetical protein ACLFPP_07840 [Spirochaetaceae bacterium]